MKYPDQVIENLVESEASVAVQGTVNGLGLRDLDLEVSSIMSNIESQRERINDLNTKFTTVQADNDRLTCGKLIQVYNTNNHLSADMYSKYDSFLGVYEKISYGESVWTQRVEFAGKLTLGQWGEETLYVAVRDCGLACTCETRSALYQVRLNGPRRFYRVIVG